MNKTIKLEQSSLDTSLTTTLVFILVPRVESILDKIINTVPFSQFFEIFLKNKILIIVHCSRKCFMLKYKSHFRYPSDTKIAQAV